MYLCCNGLKHLQCEGSYVKYKNSPGGSLRCLYSQPHQGEWDQIQVQTEQNQSLMLLYGEVVHDNTKLILLVVKLTIKNGNKSTERKYGVNQKLG